MTKVYDIACQVLSIFIYLKTTETNTGWWTSLARTFAWFTCQSILIQIESRVAFIYTSRDLKIFALWTRYTFVWRTSALEAICWALKTFGLLSLVADTFIISNWARSSTLSTKKDANNTANASGPRCTSQARRLAIYTSTISIRIINEVGWRAL